MTKQGIWFKKGNENGPTAKIWLRRGGYDASWRIL